MTLTDLAAARLWSQQIALSKCKTAKDVVSWMGAMQAQDYNMSEWAIGVRCPAATAKKVRAAFDKGAILRTHLLRPTWHLVTADDIYWLLALTGPHILSSLRSRHKELELPETVFRKSNKVIEKVLSAGKHLLREEMVAELKKAKIATDENRSSHLLFRAELDGIICSGIARDNRQTYALLAERVPEKRTLEREEALATLAGRYFESRGPATLKDFINWSGLSVTDAKRAMEVIKTGLLQETINGETYWYSKALSIPPGAAPAIHLLPGFDEFIIGYKDRSACLPPEHTKKVVNVNGIFRPVIVVDGQVKGLWKKALVNNQVVIEIDSFQPGKKLPRKLVEQAAEKVGTFLGKPAVVTYSNVIT